MHADKPRKTRPSLRDRIENNIALCLIGAVIAGFATGYGTYEAVIKTSGNQIVPSGAKILSADEKAISANEESISVDELKSLRVAKDKLESQERRIRADRPKKRFLELYARYTALKELQLRLTVNPSQAEDELSAFRIHEPHQIGQSLEQSKKLLVELIRLWWDAQIQDTLDPEAPILRDFELDKDIALIATVQFSDDSQWVIPAENKSEVHAR